MKYLIPAFCALMLMGYGMTTPAHAMEKKAQHSAKSIECSKLATKKACMEKPASTSVRNANTARCNRNA